MIGLLNNWLLVLFANIFAICKWLKVFAFMITIIILQNIFLGDSHHSPSPVFGLKFPYRSVFIPHRSVVGNQYIEC